MLHSPSLRHIGFSIPNDDVADDLDPGFESRLSLIRRAESLGYDSAWINDNGTEESPFGGFIASAVRHTNRIAIGFGCERRNLGNPTETAAGLATVDILGSSRLHAEIHAIETDRLPVMREPVGDLIDLAPVLNRSARDLGNGRAASATGQPDCPPTGGFRARRRRVWCDAGSPGCAAWAGASGLNLVIGAMRGRGTIRAAATDPLALIEAYWNAHAGEAPPRVLASRVILPLDSADRATRRHYEEFAAAARNWAGSRQSGSNRRGAAVLTGCAGEIIEKLRRDPVLFHVAEFRLELPPGFGADDHEQILSDFMRLVAPGIGHGHLH